MTVQQRIIKPEVIDFLFKADQTYSLRQREKITLGLLAQHEALTARQLAEKLDLPEGETTAVASWIGRLQDWRIVCQTGRTKGTRYYIDPKILRKLEFPSHTTLTRIEPHRLKALILEDLHRHHRSSFGEIHQRIGEEIPAHLIRQQIKTLVKESKVIHEGQNRWRRYSVA